MMLGDFGTFAFDGDVGVQRNISKIMLMLTSRALKLALKNPNQENEEGQEMRAHSHIVLST